MDDLSVFSADPVPPGRRPVLRALAVDVHDQLLHLGALLTEYATLIDHTDAPNGLPQFGAPPPGMLRATGDQLAALDREVGALLSGIGHTLGASGSSQGQPAPAAQLAIAPQPAELGATLYTFLDRTLEERTTVSLALSAFARELDRSGDAGLAGLGQRAHAQARQLHPVIPAGRFIRP